LIWGGPAPRAAVPSLRRRCSASQETASPRRLIPPSGNGRREVDTARGDLADQSTEG